MLDLQSTEKLIVAFASKSSIVKITLPKLNSTCNSVATMRGRTVREVTTKIALKGAG